MVDLLVPVMVTPYSLVTVKQAKTMPSIMFYYKKYQNFFLLRNSLLYKELTKSRRPRGKKFLIINAILWVNKRIKP
jgi:hypothetical protein